MSGISLPWCCTGRGKKNKNVRLVLPASKEESYQALEEDDTPAAPSCAQCGIFLAIILLIGILGAVGMVTFALVAPGSYDDFMAFIEDYEAITITWFTTTLSYDRCADGLFIPGPLPSRLNVTVFMLLLLWSFMGVAVAADIFMVPRLPPHCIDAQLAFV